MESAPGEGGQRDYTRHRIWIAVAYFGIPVAVCALVWWWRPDWFSSHRPVYWWRFIYCWLVGFWGLAFRAFQMRETYKHDSPFPVYVTADPLALLVSGSAVFTLLSLFEDALQGLFWTAAVPLCTVLGFYVRPNEWLLKGIFQRQIKD